MIGKIIGNYQITDELAQGGMGTIYRGHHLRLPREVAIKSILLDTFSVSAQAQLKARFCREACIQSQLDHPHIVRVYEFFETEINYFLVMEYVPGMSLRELLDRQGVLAPAQTVDLLKQILSALDHAHNFTYVDELNNSHTGIIHRDINPANLLLDDKGGIKITDFGAVKFAGQSGLTQSGFHPGTVEYMSPEQLRGWEIDARSDIYSVGVTFYEMLTGEVPFPRTDGGSDWEVRKGHIELDPPSILESHPEAPPELVVIAMRALQKEPDARYQSAAEFSSALRVYERLYTDSEPKPRLWPGKLTEEARVSSLFKVVKEIKRIISETIPILAGRRGRTLAAIVTAMLLAGAILDIYLFSQRSDRRTAQDTKARAEAVPPKTAESLTAPGKVAVNNQTAPRKATRSAALKRAERFEKKERYDDAIATYEAYLRHNPDIGDARTVSAKIAEIRRFQRLIETAKAAAGENRLMDARRSYTEALRIYPDSIIAKTGLAGVERRITASLSGR